MNYPRVLFLADEIPQSSYAGGILLYRLFQGYPADRLLIISQTPHPDSMLLPVRYEVLELLWKRLAVSRLSELVRSLDVQGLLPAFYRRAESMLKGFEPDVVVTVLQTLPYYRAAARFAKLRGLPLISIVHDIPGKFDEVLPFFKSRQEKIIGAVYRQSSRRLCVSPEMAQYLESKYGVPGEVLYPNRSEAITPRDLELTKAWRDPNKFTLGYAGSINYGYGEVLEQICATISGTKFRIFYYGRHDKKYLAHFPAEVVLQRGFASTPEKTWARVKEECDAVLLPYSFSSDYRELYSSHFPSKLTEYLALQVPVVVVGPRYATGLRWGLRNQHAALTLTDADPATWLAGFELLAESSNLRASLASAGYRVAERDFSPVTLKNHFLSVIREIAA